MILRGPLALFLCSLFLLASCQALLWPGEETVPSGDYVFVYETKVRYENRGDQPWPLSDGDVAFCLFINNSWQEVELKWTSRPVEAIVEDEDGNLWAILDVPDRLLEPGEELELAARYEIRSRAREPPDISVELSGTLDDVPPELRDLYCGRAACWLTDDEELRALAHQLAAGRENVLEIIRSFVRWIYEHITYRTFEVPLYPNETYSGREGDCDDQANLFITLCRIVGIPAYLQIGCIYDYSPWPEEMEVWDGHVSFRAENIAWHGWAIVYVPPWGWLPVDLTASFGLDEDPLNAIRTAVIWSQEAILCYEIKTDDYVADVRAYRDEVEEHDIYIYEEESLTLVRVEGDHEQVDELISMLTYYLIMTLAVIGGTAVILAVICTRKGREEPVVVYTAPYSLYHS